LWGESRGSKGEAKKIRNRREALIRGAEHHRQLRIGAGFILFGSRGRELRKEGELERYLKILLDALRNGLDAEFDQNKIRVFPVRF